MDKGRRLHRAAKKGENPEELKIISYYFTIVSKHIVLITDVATFLWIENSSTKNAYFLGALLLPL